MPRDPRQHLGRLGEQLAAEHLERLGYVIVARNHRTRFGELDLVACDGGTLVFCEVKTRRGRGQPWDALHEAKRVQVRRMARAYLTEVTDRPRVAALRFDAIGVCIDAHGRLTRLDHLEDAF
jgi:putative endonuclease